MISEAQIEEAISVGMSRQLAQAHVPHIVKEVVKYSNTDSAPSPHGLAVEFESGERFEILLKRVY